MIGEDPRSAGAFRIVPAEVDRHEKAAKAVAKSVLRLSDLGKTYEADGQKYLLVRHFMGKAPLESIVLAVAERRVDREMGL